MGLKEEFEQHAEKAKTLPAGTSNENKLILYGLYKQATVGNVNTRGAISLAHVANLTHIHFNAFLAKWDAWKAVEGKSQEEAMGDYITKVKQLLEDASC
ncbi:acyl-coa-binding protein [Phtheirospermum japonicum]|uniref:Acyl-coa-binding protein n=1 Tax=Phtheirospermum japonicum TaxID=374723 RepID=A0A830AYX0_9LAMI|nr:acyl-coa-binding protein [Phtheirospermum japonicum]